MTASHGRRRVNDRLYDLLPVVYRQRDREVGEPLRHLLDAIAAQVDLLEEDIARLYDDWFIETCDDWVVPYLGDLIGYAAAGPPDPVSPPDGCFLSTRREVANAVSFRRRKGSSWLLEELAEAVTGWPARAVEFGRLLGQTQSLDHPGRRCGGTVDIRSAESLDRLGGAFAQASHSTDLRSIGADRAFGAFNVDNVAVYVWRLPVLPSTRSVAYCLEEAGDNCFTFSVLGNDTPLYTRPAGASAPDDLADEVHVPSPIRRSALEKRVVVQGQERVEASDRYYGAGRSFAVWLGAEAVPASRIVPADLRNWRVRPPPGHVAVDPELGRLVVSPEHGSGEDVLVSYHYAAGSRIGGGEYGRALDIAADARVYRVGVGAEFTRIGDAYRRWQGDGSRHGIIELRDNGVYPEPLDFVLGSGRTLEIRAANRTRPVVDLLDWRAGRSDAWAVEGEAGSRLVLDGLLVTGRGVELRGTFDRVSVRHCTLVPGWSVHPDGQRRRPSEPSLSLVNASARLDVSHSIVGAIHAVQADPTVDPVVLHVTECIVDSTDESLPALGTSEGAVAPVTLVARRATFLGEVQTHAIELAENSIFAGPVRVARRQVGCLRYCYVPTHSRTPARFCCQPDLVERALADGEGADPVPPAERREWLQAERLRVAPRFASTQYGEPTYGRLAAGCAAEIRRGAEDRSELGVFHDLFEAQREANLSVRLHDYVPAGTSVGIVFAS